MKRAVSILLILVFALSMAALTACGEKKDDSTVEATEAAKPAPDGKVFKLKDQNGAYTFSLQAYKNSSLTYKAEQFSNRTALVVTSAQKEYAVYVYINNGYKNNYDSKHENGRDDGGIDVKAGGYSGYTYPKTALNAAFFDTGTKVKKEADIVTMVVEQPQPYKHDINEVIADEELIDLLGTLKLIKSPVK